MLFSFPANQTLGRNVSQYVTDVGRTDPPGNYMNITQRLISPSGFPFFHSVLFSSNKVHCGANLPNYR